MDQLKTLLSKAAKQQFWIISGLAVVLGIVGYFMASSEINDLFQKQKTALDTHIDGIKTVSAAVPTHPNEHSQQQMDQIIEALRVDVESAWGRQYQRQAEFLEWPEEINQPALIAIMKQYTPVEIKLDYPAEPYGLAKTMKQAYAVYFDEQMPNLAEIIGVEWVGKPSTTAAGGGMGYGGMAGMAGMGGYGGESGGYGGDMYGGGGGYGGGGYGAMGGPGMGMGMMGMGGAMSNKVPDLVTWQKPSQDELISAIQMWRGDSPTVYEIYYTQENMWILEGLLNIIKKTNGSAIANFQCAIKEIKFLRIGKTAVNNAGVIDRPGATGGMGGMGMGMGMGAGMGSAYGGESGYGAGMMGGETGGYGGEGGYGGAGMMGGESGGYGGEGPGMGGEGGYGGDMYGSGGGMSRDPADRRYVDANFQPVSGEDLRTRMKSGEPSDAYFAVAKRVPVRMRFKIDQRKTQEFLANCGNADLMFEVHQVRLGDTVPASAGGGAGGMMGGGYGGMMGGMGGEAPGMMGGGYGGESGGYGGDMYGSGYGGESGGYGMGGPGMGGPGMGGMGMGGMGMGITPLERDPWELDIEVYGVVYLFNPPDIERLGVNKVTETTELDVTVDVVPEENPLPAPSDAEAAAAAAAAAAGEPGATPVDPAAATDGGAGGPNPNGPNAAGMRPGGPNAGAARPGGPRPGGPGRPGPNAGGPNAGGPNAGGPNAGGPNAGGPNAGGAGNPGNAGAAPPAGPAAGTPAAQ